MPGGGVELATAYVALKVDGSQVDSGVKKSLGGVEGEAGRVGTRSGRRMGAGMASSFSGHAKGIAASLVTAFAAVKVKDFLGDSIAEARESQKVGAISNQVIKTTGSVANVTASHVGRLSTAISNKVGIDDEAIQSGANMLLTFRNIRNEAGKGNKIFDESTKVLTDYAVVMKKDPSKAAIQLGKALNDPVKGITALSKAGVTFNEKQKATIATMVKTGHTIDAQKLILGELKTEFGGAGAASSTAGEKAQVAWQNLKEQLGTALLPTIDRVEGKLSTEVIPAVSKFLGQMQSGKGAGGRFAADMKSAFTDIKGYVGDAYKIGKEFVDVFNSLPGGVQKALVIGAGAGVVGSKIPGAKTAVSLGTKAIVKTATSGIQKVFVTNPGFSGGSGVPGTVGKAGSATAIEAEGAAVATALRGASVRIAGASALMAIGDAGNEVQKPGTGKHPGDRGLINPNTLTPKQLATLTDAQKKMLGLDKAARQAAQGQRTANAALSTAGSILAGSNPKLSKYGNALQDLPKDVRTKVETPGAVTSMSDVAELTKRYHLTPKQVRTLVNLSGAKPAKGATDALIKSLTTADKKTARPKVNQQGAGPSKGAVDGLVNSIGRLHDKKVTVTVHTNKTGSAAFNAAAGFAPHRAGGGNVTAGRAYTVGELRPEIFVPDVSGRIIPRVSDSASGSGGAGSGFPRSVIFRVGEREFVGYMSEVADSRVSSAADLADETLRSI